VHPGIECTVNAHPRLECIEKVDLTVHKEINQGIKQGDKTRKVACRRKRRENNMQTKRKEKKHAGVKEEKERMNYVLS
jgi:hypothetical protein